MFAALGNFQIMMVTPQILTLNVKSRVLGFQEGKSHFTLTLSERNFNFYFKNGPRGKNFIGNLGLFHVANFHLLSSLSFKLLCDLLYFSNYMHLRSGIYERLLKMSV